MRITGGWKDHLSGCPSQCEFWVEHAGREYILYLRWRWEDPWQAHVLQAKDGKAFPKDNPFLTKDLFAENNLFFSEDQVEQAKGAILALATLWLRSLEGKPQVLNPSEIWAG